MRFVITGSGRCGTKYMSRLLTAAGTPCGHEAVFAYERRDWGDLVADSSWMAVPSLASAGLPVVLMVRHPLSVVKSLTEIGFLVGHDDQNPCHNVLREFAPEIYEWPSHLDRALDMWYRLNLAALEHAELVFRLEQFSVEHLTRLLRWADRDTSRAKDAFHRVGPTNRLEGMRAKTGIRHTPSWGQHDPDLAKRAKALAALLGYGS